MATALSVLEYAPGRSQVPYDVKSAVFVDVWSSRTKTDDGDKGSDDDAGEDAYTGDDGKKDCTTLLSQPYCHFPTCFYLFRFRPALPDGFANATYVCFIFHRG